MTKLKQLNPNYPNGDCQRTVFACLLDYLKPDIIPNFTEMEDCENNWVKNIYDWLDSKGLTYVELTQEQFINSSFLPIGLCTIVGKSPRGDYNHIVIGEVKLSNDNNYELHYVWDTSPLHDGKFLDNIQYIGFLSQKLNTTIIDYIGKFTSHTRDCKNN